MINFLAASICSRPFSASSGDRELFDQLHRRFVGAAVQRAAQRADAADDGGVEVGQGGDDRARGERRGVELMFGVKNQRHVDGAAVQLVGLFAVQQMEKMSGGAVVVGGGLDALSGLMKLVPVKQHGAETAGEPIRHGDLSAARVFGLQGAQHRTAGAHHVHRMSAARGSVRERFSAPQVGRANCADRVL